MIAAVVWRNRPRPSQCASARVTASFGTRCAVGQLFNIVCGTAARVAGMPAASRADRPCALLDEGATKHGVARWRWACDEPSVL
jgi:hypothetical protein